MRNVSGSAGRLVIIRELSKLWTPEVLGQDRLGLGL